MRKVFISTVIFLLIAQFAAAQNDSLKTNIDTTSFEYANAMYDQGDYAKSAQVYEKLLAANGPSAEIYYNLGNCYYKLKEEGKSILNYERANELAPGDEDIHYNLQLANLMIRDKIDPVNEMVLLIWWRWFIQLFPVNTWTFISLLLLWISLAGFLVYRFAIIYRVQKNGFYIFFITIVLFLISITATCGRSSYDKHYAFAIVMSPSSIVKSEPNETGTNLFLLHEGLKIRILHPQNNWTEIKMPDGNVGWVKNEDVEEI